MNWPAVGAILLALAVTLGAFGAHGLREHLDAYSMGIWEKAVFYHFVHALGLLIAGVLRGAGAISGKGAISTGPSRCSAASTRSRRTSC